MWQGSEVICVGGDKSQRLDSPQPREGSCFSVVSSNIDTCGILRLVHCPRGQGLEGGQVWILPYGK